MSIQVEEFFRKSFPVQAVRVTVENMGEVADWCTGILWTDEDEGTYIKVRVENPLTEKQTKAFVGDWVLYSGKGYKVYTDKAFGKSFVRNASQASASASVGAPSNVFEGNGSPIAAASSSGSNPGGTRAV